MESQHKDNAQEPQERKFREPESSDINVSSKKDPKSYKLVAKLILKKFGTLDLKSLGNASENVVALADMMVRNGFAEFTSIKSEIAELDDVNNDGGVRSGIKFVVKLRKSDKFDELTQDLQ